MQTISSACFRHCRRLENLIFEFGSRLSIIGEFLGLTCLFQSFSLPMTLRQLTGLSVFGLRSVGLGPGIHSCEFSTIFWLRPARAPSFTIKGMTKK
jgi:hypothetical protein